MLRIHEEIIAIPKFLTLWSGVKVRMVGQYDRIDGLERVARKSFCSSECRMGMVGSYELPPHWQAIFRR